MFLTVTNLHRRGTARFDECIMAFEPTRVVLAHGVDSDSDNPPFQRLARVVECFRNTYTFPTEPAVGVAVAPGRVNLIGEHIDYEGYSVLPMAIAQNVAVAFTCTTPSVSPSSALVIEIANTNASFSPVTVSLGHDHRMLTTTALFAALTAASTPPSTVWTRYVLCGLMAVAEWYPGILEQTNRHIHMLVDGCVPPACGLSSSSALVVASALAFARVLRGHRLPTRVELAERCRDAEQYVGTVGGGMDQAVSCLARRDAALHVHFCPQFRVDAVDLPPDFQRREAVFLVVNSGVHAHKAVDAATHFNKRVVECALAAKLLGKHYGLPHWRQITQLVEVEQARTGSSLCELVDDAGRLLTEAAYSRPQIEAMLGPTDALFTGSRLEHAAKRVMVDSQATFKLRQRVQHVWREAERVHRFRNALRRGAYERVQDRLAELGRLMLESHTSCRDLYECSCVALDRIVDLAMQSGAHGARLTGAGWGGCAVVLVSVDRVETVRQALWSKYFTTGSSMTEAPPVGSIVESTAADGAHLYQIC